MHSDHELASIVDIDKALNSVQEPSLLPPRVIELAKEVVKGNANELVKRPSAVQNAADFLAVLGDRKNGGWNFDKLVSLNAAVRRISSEEAHNSVGSILISAGKEDEDYRIGAFGCLHKCPDTGKITQAGVKVFGSGMNLILGYYNDAFGIAFKRFFYKLFESVVNEIRASMKYIAINDQTHRNSTAAFNNRKQHEMAQYNLSELQSQALGMRHDKDTHKVILALPDGVSARQSARDAGLPDSKTIAKSYNQSGALRNMAIRDMIDMAITLAPSMAPDDVAKSVLNQIAPAFVVKNPHSGLPVSRKRQAELMFSNREAKKQLQRRGQLQ